jgi:hypothetical protein
MFTRSASLGQFRQAYHRQRCSRLNKARRQSGSKVWASKLSTQPGRRVASRGRFRSVIRHIATERQNSIPYLHSHNQDREDKSELCHPVGLVRPQVSVGLAGPEFECHEDTGPGTVAGPPRSPSWIVLPQFRCCWHGANPPTRESENQSQGMLHGSAGKPFGHQESWV